MYAKPKGACRSRSWGRCASMVAVRRPYPLGGSQKKRRPIYAYTGAESDAPQKFVLDLRGKSATPEAIQASQNNLTDVGAVAP